MRRRGVKRGNPALWSTPVLLGVKLRHDTTYDSVSYSPGAPVHPSAGERDAGGGPVHNEGPVGAGCDVYDRILFGLDVSAWHPVDSAWDVISWGISVPDDGAIIL